MMRLNKHCLRIDNDVEGYQQLRFMVKMYGQATVMYNVMTRRLLVMPGCQEAAGSFVSLGVYTSACLLKISVQTIYDQLAEALEQRWERGWVNG